MKTINNKKELEFYIMSDLMMNRGYFKEPFLLRIRHLFVPDYIINFLRLLRIVCYYQNSHGGGKSYC